MAKNKTFPNLDNKLQLWIKNNWNVLFSSKAGVGKTSIIIQAFEKAGLRYKMFSGSTLDPWVDMVGIPKEVKEDGISYLELIPPKDLATDSIDAIFIDEFSRSNKKIRNAVLELIQFKSINGRKYNNLKIVWAAINPSDDEDHIYDVEPLDPAQKDRFHIHVDLPYLVSREYFINKYKDEGLVDTAIEWWDSLTNDARNKVSPRRLDYALEIFLNYGDIEDVLPQCSNPSQLKTKLKETPVMHKLKTLLDNKDDDKSRNFLKDEGNYVYSISSILNNKSFFEYFIPLLEKEKLSSLLSEHTSVQDYILNIYKNSDNLTNILKDIIETNTNHSLVNKIEKRFLKDKAGKTIKEAFFDMNSLIENKNKELSLVFKDIDNKQYHLILENLQSTYSIVNKFKGNNPKINGSFDACKIFNQIKDNIPKDLSSENAIETINLIEHLLSISSERVARRWESIMPVINYCIKTLAENKYNLNILLDFELLCSFIEANKSVFYFKI